MKEILRYLRKVNDLTQAEVARRIGFSRQSYGKYESGALTPPDEAVARLAALYGVAEPVLRGNMVPSVWGAGSAEGGAAGCAQSGAVTAVRSGGADSARGADFARKALGASGGSGEYRINGDAGLLKVASPACEDGGYDAYFDGNTVRVLDKVEFRAGQRFRLYPVAAEDEALRKKREREAAWETMQAILARHKPLELPPDEDPFYKEAYHSYLEEKYGCAD